MSKTDREKNVSPEELARLVTRVEDMVQFFLLQRTRLELASRARVAATSEEAAGNADLHHLVDQLPPDQVDAARKFLRFLITDARVDPDPLSVDEVKALERGREQAARGETVRWKDMKGELDRDV